MRFNRTLAAMLALIAAEPAFGADLAPDAQRGRVVGPKTMSSSSHQTGLGFLP